jgi:hypothetical protein
MGMSDAPRGPKADKIWANALRMAVMRESDETDPTDSRKKLQYLNVIANNLVKEAAKGDMQAAKEIGDRLDGKPHQSANVDVGASDSLADLLAAVAQNGKRIGHE